MYIGITDEIFKNVGHVPSEKDILNKFESGIEIDLLMDLMICCGKLFGPVHNICVKFSNDVFNFRW